MTNVHSFSENISMNMELCTNLRIAIDLSNESILTKVDRVGRFLFKTASETRSTENGFLSNTVQGAPKNCAPFVWLLWRSYEVNFLDFYTNA